MECMASAEVKCLQWQCLEDQESLGSEKDTDPSWETEKCYEARFLTYCRLHSRTKILLTETFSCALDAEFVFILLLLLG